MDGLLVVSCSYSLLPLLVQCYTVYLNNYNIQSVNGWTTGGLLFLVCSLYFLNKLRPPAKVGKCFGSGSVRIRIILPYLNLTIGLFLEVSQFSAEDNLKVCLYVLSPGRLQIPFCKLFLRISYPISQQNVLPDQNYFGSYPLYQY